MKPPTPAPRIWRDNSRIYIEYDTGTIVPFDLSHDGVGKMLKIIPHFPTVNDFRQQLKPDWAVRERKLVQARDRVGKAVKVRKTRQASTYSEGHLKNALDAIHKVKK